MKKLPLLLGLLCLCASLCAQEKIKTTHIKVRLYNEFHKEVLTKDTLIEANIPDAQIESIVEQMGLGKDELPDSIIKRSVKIRHLERPKLVFGDANVDSLMQTGGEYTIPYERILENGLVEVGTKTLKARKIDLEELFPPDPTAMLPEYEHRITKRSYRNMTTNQVVNLTFEDIDRIDYSKAIRDTVERDNLLEVLNFVFKPNYKAGVFEFSISIDTKKAVNLKITNPVGNPVYNETIDPFPRKYEANTEIALKMTGELIFEAEQNGNYFKKRIIVE